MESTPARSLRRIYLVLALLCTAVAVYGSLVPFRYSPVDLDVALDRLARGTTNLFGGGSRVDWGVNVVLFVPISYFWLAALAPDGAKSWRSAVAVGAVLACCMGASLAVELAQAWFPPRVPSLADVVAQSIGAAAGCVIWLAAGRTGSDWLRLYLDDIPPARQVDWLLQAYLLGLVIYSLMPLNLTLSPTEIYRKYEAGRIELLPFRYPYESRLEMTYALSADAVIFIPVGMLAASAFVPRGRKVRSLPRSVALGVAIVAGIECCQLFVLSRFTTTTDLIMGTLGVLIGVAIARGCRGRPLADLPERPHRECPAVAGKWLAAAVVYGLLLPAIFWAPYDFTCDKELIKRGMDGFFSVPLGAALRGSPFGNLASLVQQFLLFIPLGVLFVLAANPLPARFRRLALALLLAGAWVLALGVELGQIALPHRTGALDDTFVCTLGTLTGMAAASRATKGARRAS